MTARFLILPAADRDLEAQAAWLAEHSGLETALRFLDAVDEGLSFLARNPNTGAPRESANPLLVGVRVGRVRGFAKHLVFYRPVEDGIEVVRVLHGHRDVDAVLGPEV